MQKQGLKRHSDKMCNEGDFENTPQFILPIYPNGQNIIWDMMEERPYWVSVVREFPNQLILLHYNYLKNKCKHLLQYQFLALPKC